MVGKKGYVRTIEAIIAIFVSFTLLVLLIPTETVTETRREAQDILVVLKNDIDFRNCVQNDDLACINSSIREQLPDSYDFALNISLDEKGQGSGLPDKRVFADSAFLTGNATNSTTKVVRLFYWTK